MVTQITDAIRDLFGSPARPEADQDASQKPRQFEFIYSESIRNLSQQAQVLDSIRSRAGVLIAAASVVSALLGGPALQGGPFRLSVGLAVIVFLLSMYLALRVVAPRKNWRFRFGIADIVAKVESSEDVDLVWLQRTLALRNEKNYEANETQLNELFETYRWAARLLILDVLLWLVALSSIRVVDFLL